MTVPPTETTPNLEGARQRLEEARARETEVVSKLEAAAAALGRGRQAYDAASAEYERLESAENEWIEREAKRLQAVYAAGHQTPPALVADPKAQQARTSALVNVRARAAALEQLAVDEQAVREELVAAQRAVEAAAGEVRAAQGEIAARDFELACAELLRAGAALQRHHGSGLDTPLDQFGAPGARMQRALERYALVRTALVDDRNVPLSRLRRAAGGFPAEPREDAA
jgi:hypothetical protein